MKKSEFKMLAYHPVILADKRLSAIDRTIIALIAWLDNKDGCFASNQFLAEFANCSIGTVSKSIAKLIKYKYVISSDENKGRTYIRKVRHDFKYNEAEDDKVKGSIAEKSMLASRK